MKGDAMGKRPVEERCHALAAVVAAGFLFSPAAHANKVTKLHLHKPKTLVIVVKSSDGKSWDQVVGMSDTLEFSVDADCRIDKKAGNPLNELRIQVSRFSKQLISPQLEPTQNGYYRISTPMNNKPFQIAIQPVAGDDVRTQAIRVCNDMYELFSKHDNVPDLMQNGFTETLNDAGYVKVELKCNPLIKKGRLDTHSQEKHYDINVRCLPYDGPKAPELKQMQFVKPATAKEAKVYVNHALYRGRCPVMIAYKGHIVSDGKGTLKYHFEHSDGYRSPEHELKFPGPGKLQTERLTRAVYAKKPGGQLGIGKPKGVSYDYDGWIRLVVTDALGRVYRSPKQRVRVDCVSGKAGPSLKNAPPAKPGRPPSRRDDGRRGSEAAPVFRAAPLPSRRPSPETDGGEKRGRGSTRTDGFAR